MLVLLGVVLVTAAGFLLYRHWQTKRVTLRWVPHDDWPVDDPVLYENPACWLAIKSNDPDEVRAALELHDPLPCSWAEGIERAAEHRVFVTPPVDGWVLVFGAGLPEPTDDVDEFFRFITTLSRRIGLVLYFSSRRVVGQHAWVKTLNGQIVRAYAWAGETLWNQGELTQAERDLRLRCQPYGATESRPAPMNEVARFNCERVAALAARWSIDPKTIDTRMLRRQTGIAGEFTEGTLR
jgi:hypothetical protein